MTRAWPVLGAVVTVLALPPAAGAQAGGSKLFLQQADAGSLRPVSGSPGRFVLTLRRPAARVVAFTDRPARRASSQGLRDFVAAWPRRFRRSAPNAAIEVRDAPGHRDVMVLTLSRPRLDRSGRTLTFRARRLTGRGTAGVRAFLDRADRRLPRRFRHVDLFIDSADDGTVQVEFRLSTPTADAAAIQLTNTTTQLRYGFSSTGPATVQVGPTVVAMEPQSPFTAPVTIGASFEVATVTRVRGMVLDVPAGATLTGQAGDGATVNLRAGSFSLPTG